MRDAPQDEDAQAALRQQLKKALRDDEDFLAELTALLKAVQSQVKATEGSVGVGRDMAHSAAATGDGSSAAAAEGGGSAVAGGSIQAEHIYATNIISGVQIVTSSDHLERAKGEEK